MIHKDFYNLIFAVYANQKCEVSYNLASYSITVVAAVVVSNHKYCKRPKYSTNIASPLFISEFTIPIYPNKVLLFIIQLSSDSL